ncbi:MAG: rRNA methyltransferase [Treponema sp.]|nr:rRNA methyltransferase [Treponema sp.]
MNLFPPLSPESRRILDGLPGLVDKVFPLPNRFRPSLPRDVAELSRLLTGGRGDRAASYPGQPKFLSAYLRYFLPWNLYRLCRLLPSLPLSLHDGDALVDLGSGPLTFAAALWISRPDLRGRALEFRCVDQSGAALDAGKELCAALFGNSSPWKIKTIRAVLGAPGSGAGGRAHDRGLYGPPARLVSAINFFNELYEDIPHSDGAGLHRFADKQARLLSSLAAEDGALLVMEPGVPRSGEFTAALRSALLDRGRPPAAPCPHAGACPCPGRAGEGRGRAGGKPGDRLAATFDRYGGGGKGRWCHFAFETADAAPALQKLSAAAGIPKARAVLSFIYSGAARPGPARLPGLDHAGNRSAAADRAREAGTGAAAGLPALPVRIISDPFPLPSGGAGAGRNRAGGKPGDRPGGAAVFGRYGCGEKGLVLIRGRRELMARYESGVLAEFVLHGAERRDPKSGALVLDSNAIP